MRTEILTSECGKITYEIGFSILLATCITVPHLHSQVCIYIMYSILKFHLVLIFHQNEFRQQWSLVVDNNLRQQQP